MKSREHGHQEMENPAHTATPATPTACRMVRQKRDGAHLFQGLNGRHLGLFSLPAIDAENTESSFTVSLVSQTSQLLTVTTAYIDRGEATRVHKGDAIYRPLVRMGIFKQHYVNKVKFQKRKRKKRRRKSCFEEGCVFGSQCKSG